ncbi:methyltransferase-like protein 27 [Seriola aureovittata]|uniref:methyltransferase-like protein 27 n=2 Tax=Seriola TaxID=8160 RepID=UPI0024BEE11B|nr:methyltransferase-like protein 27 [Seriola aureovittata]
MPESVMLITCLLSPPCMSEGVCKMSGCSRNVDDMRALLQSCKSFGPQQRMKFYDSWAETYEQDSEVMNYRAPHLVIDFLNANFSGDRQGARVLDVACGSGLVAKLMFELGFRLFVGVDGSRGMLDQAAKTGLYQNLRLALLGTQALPAQTGAFDVVIIVGALRDGFVPVSVVRELCCAAKPGGLVCMSRVDPRSESGDRYKACMERELQLMEEEGLWTHVVSADMHRYMMDVYNSSNQEEQNQQYLSGTMSLYRKSPR